MKDRPERIICPHCGEHVFDLVHVPADREGVFVNEARPTGNGCQDVQPRFCPASNTHLVRMR